MIKQNVILSTAKNLPVLSNRKILRHKCLRMTSLYYLNDNDIKSLHFLSAGF